MKKVTGFFVALLAIASFAFIAPNSDLKKVTVVIDAGHGGHDHGATVGDFTEKEIVQQITNKIKIQNIDKDVEIIFTRETDKLMTFEERFSLINSVKPDLVISLHVNSLKNSNARGMEFYVAKKDNPLHEKSNAFAQKLSQKFIENNRIKIRGIKEAPFMMLKKSEVPAVLIELGFLTNHEDKKYLTDENEQNRIASTILEFISEIE